ncbi:NAD-dependent epimerase/dehydratase family protein [Kitasatospora sp. NPDC057223]|uniref:NAD-dependent epimerase/dehydratase family protein n=1 Tax=Kitasatospora sp. NPDC057223 TaxID=3346055 RepID=UPI003641CEA0
MTRILLTGAAGFAGARVLHRILADTDWHVVGTVSPRRGSDTRIVQLLTAHPEWAIRVTVVRCDLGFEMTGSTIDRIGPVEHIVNLASDTQIDLSITDPARIIRSNVALMLNVLELARIVQPRTVLHVGTDEEYGPIHGGDGPHREWDAILPANPYSGSKAAQSAIAITYWRTYGLPLILTRTMNILGPGQPAVKFVPQVISRILAGEPVRIFASADGQSSSRHWLDAWELGGALIHILGHATVQQHPQYDRPALFHIVGEERTNLALAESIAGILRRPLHVELVDAGTSRPGHDLRYGLDGGTLAALGWTPGRTLDDTLREIVATHLARVPS